MRLVCLLIGGFFLLFGVWFLYDGFVGFPNENARVTALEKQLADARSEGNANAERMAEIELMTVSRHTVMDLAIQKYLGAAFVVCGVPLLAVALWPRGKAKPLPPPPLPPMNA
jgi:hypothetical protein